MKEEVLKILMANPGTYISGQMLGEMLKISRTAVWKHINSLKEDGYVIESVSKKGYKLISAPDILTGDEIKPFLNTKLIGKNFYHFDTLDSTNTKAKELALYPDSDGTVVISEEQTEGKGRLGREWISPAHKGIWMSIIIKPDIEPFKVPGITHISAAAVVTALGEIGVESLVKWPNDIILNNKKICGILTEMSGELNKISYVVVGIGINANLSIDDIPSDIRKKASSIYIETGKAVDRKLLTAKILNNFELYYKDFLASGSIKKAVEICKKYSILLGRDIKVITGKNEFKARALDIDENGGLVVKLEDGRIETIISGEISVRGLNSYI